MARHLSGGGGLCWNLLPSLPQMKGKMGLKIRNKSAFLSAKNVFSSLKMSRFYSSTFLFGLNLLDNTRKCTHIQFRRVSVAGCGSKIRQRGPFCASDSFGHNLCVTSSIFFSTAAASIRSPAVRATPRGAAALPAECHRRRGRGHDVRRRLVRGDDAVRHQLLGYGGAAGPVGAPGHAAPAAQGRAAAPGGVSIRRPHEILDQQPEAGVRRAALIQTPAQY